MKDAGNSDQPATFQPGGENPLARPPASGSSAVSQPVAGAVVPREALERIFARAVELQAEMQNRLEGIPGGISEGISESRMLDIAREVGIDPINIRQAIAEERARLPMPRDESGLFLDAIGPGHTIAERTVPGTPAEVLARMEEWMPRMEMLERKRKVGDRISWEPTYTPMKAFMRMLGIGTRSFDLIRTDQVSAVAMSIDEKRSVVVLQGDTYGVRREQRTALVAASIALFATWAMLAIPAAILLVSNTLAVIAVTALTAAFGAAGYGIFGAIRRSYRKLIDRVHLRLEQLLDELESGKLRAVPGFYEQVRDVLSWEPKS